MTDCACEAQHEDIKIFNFSSLVKAIGGLFASSTPRRQQALYGHDLPPHLQKDIGYGNPTEPFIR